MEASRRQAGGQAALAHPRAAPLRWRLRVDARALWIWALCGVLVVYLGLEGGGYDPVVRSDVGIVVWWVVLLGAALAVLPSARIPAAGWAAVALFAGFTAWSMLASSWSLSSERTLEEVSRLAAYLGVLVLALASYGDRRRALAHAVAATAAALSLIIGLALLSRLRPGTFPGADETAALLKTTQGRLGWPLNYWNALAALVALGLPLLLAVATSARTLIGQALAAAAMPMFVLCGYLTFSRGGAIAAAAAVIVFVALAAERIPKLATLLLGAAGGLVLVAGATDRSAVEKGLVDAAARHQGLSLLGATIVVCAGVGIAQAGIGLAARHGTLPRALRVSVPRARAILAGVVVVVVVAGLAAGVPHRLSTAWHDFKTPNAHVLQQNTLNRYATLSGHGRYTYWKTAVHAMPGHWLDGYGPGTFQLVWLPRAPFLSYVKNAHSLYIETLTETGIVGLVLLAGFLLLAVVVAVRRAFTWQPDTRTRAAAVAAACVSFMLSAAIDWVWQIPVLPVALLLLIAAVLSAPAEAGPTRSAAPAAPAGNPAAGSAPATGARRIRGAPGTIALRVGLVGLAVAALVVIGIPLAATTALRRSQAHAVAGDTAGALAQAQTAERIEPDAAAPYLQEALVYELRGEFTPALRAVRASLVRDPQNWQPWLVLSRLEAEAGHAHASLAAFRRARALDPHSPLFAS